MTQLVSLQRERERESLTWVETFLLTAATFRARTANFLSILSLETGSLMLTLLGIRITCIQHRVRTLIILTMEKRAHSSPMANVIMIGVDAV